MQKRLYRSRSDRMIWGVCGGLAKYFNIDPTIIRLIAVLSILVGGGGILAYIILAIVVPLEESTATEPRDVIKENVEEIKETASGLGREIQSTFTKEETTKAHHDGLTILGIIIVIIGVLFLLSSLKVLWWFRWSYLWPLILMALGVLIIVSARRS